MLARLPEPTLIPGSAAWLGRACWQENKVLTGWTSPGSSQLWRSPALLAKSELNTHLPTSPPPPTYPTHVQSPHFRDRSPSPAFPSRFLPSALTETAASPEEIWQRGSNQPWVDQATVRGGPVEFTVTATAKPRAPEKEPSSVEAEVNIGRRQH